MIQCTGLLSVDTVHIYSTNFCLQVPLNNNFNKYHNLTKQNNKADDNHNILLVNFS